MKTQNKIFNLSLFSKFLKSVATSGTKHPDSPALKDLFKNDFYLGVALSKSQISGNEPDAIALVKRHFNSITAENIMKWEEIHPEPNRYNFEDTDQFVKFGEKNKMHIIGHTLVWFYQTPDWVFQDDSGNPTDRDTLLNRMKEHIGTVMGRYKGRIYGWDVVNEAILPDGQFRKCKWFDILGEDYIIKAFEYAHQVDPAAELYYNDYNMWKKGQYEGVIQLVEKLQSIGIHIDGVGIQGHWGLDYPTLDEIETFMQALSNLNLKLMITELDVSVLPHFDDYEHVVDISTYDPEFQKKHNPYPDLLPDSVQEDLANRYADLFSLFLKHREKLSRITFWAVHDGQSWRRYMPIKGRADYPMLFNDHCKAKPAFDAVINLVRKRV